MSKNKRAREAARDACVCHEGGPITDGHTHGKCDCRWPSPENNARKLVLFSFDRVVSQQKPCRCTKSHTVWLGDVAHNICESTVQFFQKVTSLPEVDVAWVVEGAHPVAFLHKELPQFPKINIVPSPRLTKRWSKVVEVAIGYETVFLVCPEQLVGEKIRKELDGDDARFVFVRPQSDLCRAELLNTLLRTFTKM